MPTIPFNEEVEKIIIGDCFIGGAMPFEARTVSTTDFYLTINQQIWSIICELDENGESIDLIETHSRLVKNFPSFSLKMSELSHYTFGIAERTKIEKQVESLKTFSRLRYLQKAFVKLSEKAEKLESLDNLVSETESLLKNIKSDREAKNGTSKSLAQVIEQDVKPRLDKFVSGEAVKIPFGFEKLDASTNGGAGLGELIILGAKPKTGKSSLMMQIANFQAQSGFGVYACSREMLNFENAFRLIAQNSKFTLNYFRPNLYAETRDAILESAGFIADAPLFLDDKAKSVADMRREISRLRDENFDIKSIFVDYVQLMKSDKHSPRASKADVLEEIIYDLKDLSVEFEAVVVTAAQFNREGIDATRPKMSDFAGSSAIEKAGNLILLWQLNQEASTISGNREGELWIEAGRNVAYDKFEISFIGEKSLFILE